MRKSSPQATVNYHKFNAALQTPQCDRPLEKRGPLYFPTVLEKYRFSEKTKRHIKLIASARARPTQLQHNRTLKTFEKFCTTRGKDLLSFTKRDLIAFLEHLENSAAKKSAIIGLAGSMDFLTAALNRKSPWTQSVDRMYQAVVRRSAAEQPLARKAPKLPTQYLTLVVDKHVSPFLQNPDQVQILFLERELMFRYLTSYSILV
jgi:plasmid stabilization system protein ParE